MKSIILLCSAILLGATFLVGQEEYPYPSLSPKGKISQIVGNTTIQIEYERPNARKRKVFGALVPWNKVWRTGAGHCTKLSFSRDVIVEGQPVGKGSYSLFSIPHPDHWIIILNKDTTLYGSYNYDSTNDVARFVVTPTATNRYYESLNFDIELIPNDAKIFLSWEKTQIHFDVKTTTDALVQQFIEKQLLSGKEENSNLYAGAAEYYLYQGTNLAQAIFLADKALDINSNNGWARDLKVSIYERLQLYQKALDEIDKAVEYINANYENGKEKSQEIKSFQDRAVIIKGKMDK